MGIEVWPGKPYPRGATYDGTGVNFAVYSQVATRVEICLFDSNNPTQEIARFELPEVTEFVWHGYVSGLEPGTLYGLRDFFDWGNDRRPDVPWRKTVLYEAHVRGHPPGPEHLAQGHRQRGVLLADAGPALLPGLHRVRQQRERLAAPGRAPHRGLATLLGQRAARGRVPLRLGHHAGPHGQGRVQPQRAPVPDHQPGSGAQ